MLVLLLETIYLPRLGLTMQDLHTLGEQAEAAFADLKHFVVMYGVVVIAVLLAAVVGTNLWLTRNLFAHIREPLAALMQGIHHIQNGDLNVPIAYTKNDEFRPACDAVDEMAARLRESLAQQQREQQKKQELIAGMSHDLKSPLTTIRAYTEALLEGVAPDEAARQRYLQTIYARETDLEALVNRLFELAKLGASEYPVHPEPLPRRQTVDAILADCDREGLTLDSTAVGDSTVTADRELLGRILHNLIDNSCKYGATALTLRSTQTTAGVTLQVQDNSPGVPPEQLANLFEPFYRGDAARTNPAAGSGLGLSVVRRSMQQMGGSARAEKDIPILMVTARGEDVDKIRGLGFGADDYIEKPFSPSVLVARVKAHLAQYARLKPETAGPQRITAGPLTVDPAARTIAKNGAELPLKNKEYELLLFLMRHPEQVFSREDLYEMIWGLESMGDNMTVAVHINRLREKIEDTPLGPEAAANGVGCGLPVAYSLKTV